jgi:GNAT superfamily N-acetyltransferase
MLEELPQFTAPTVLTEAHDLETFNSGERVLDDWLRQRAMDNLQMGASRTYVLCLEGSTKVVGYFALSMGQILAQDATGAMRRNMPRNIPAVILGRLAADLAWQGKGIARALLLDVIKRSLLAASEVSARLVIVHAISKQAEDFYLHHGFTRLPVDTPTFALDLVKFKALPTKK